MDNSKTKVTTVSRGKEKVIGPRYYHQPQIHKQILIAHSFPNLILPCKIKMDGSNVTELVEQLIDPLEKLLGYKVTKEQVYYLLVLVALAINCMEN